MTGLRPLSIGEILDGAFTICRRHFVVLMTTACALQLPGALVQVAFPLIASILSAIGGSVAMVALTAQTSEALLGGQPELARGIDVGVRRLIRVGLAVIASSLLVIIATAPLVGGVFLAARLWAPDRSGLGVGPYIALIATLAMLAAVPPSYLGLRWFAVIQVAVLEQTRHVLRRSATLARGAMMKISTVWLVGFFIAGIPSALAGGGAGVVTVMVRQGLISEAALIPAIALGWLVSGITTAFMAVLLTVLYYDQRVRKDGLDVELAVSRAVAPPVPQAAGT